MKWVKIREDYENSKLTLKALAEKHNVKLGTLKSRKSRERWSRDPTKKDATKKQKVATPKRKDATKKKEQLEPIVEGDDLTDKQRLFCIYYVKTFNQTQAAIKAGYAPDSAHVEGSRLLRNAKVADEIKRLKGKVVQEVFIDAKDILNKYIQIAFADITDIVKFNPIESHKEEIHLDKDGNVERIEKIPYTYTAMRFENSDLIDGTILTEVKKGKDGLSVKLADKMKALDMLSKYFDLLSENDKKRLQEEKLKAEIAKVKGEDGTEYEDDGFIDAIKSSTDIWDEDDE